MSKMIIRIFFQSVGPDEADTVEDGDCDVLLLNQDEDEDDDEEDEDSLGILESAVEENKLYMDDDFSVLLFLRISLSSGSSFIMFMIFVNKNNIV